MGTMALGHTLHLGKKGPAKCKIWRRNSKVSQIKVLSACALQSLTPPMIMKYVFGFPKTVLDT